MSTLLQVNQQFGVEYDTPDHIAVVELFGGHQIVELQETYARNMLALIEQWCGQSEINKFNCYNAVRQVLGIADQPRWERNMIEQGEKMYVHDAVHQLPRPFVFQICGQLQHEDQWQHGVLHAGLVLGVDSRYEPVIFDKMWKWKLDIRHFSEANGYFSPANQRTRPEYVTCFPANEIHDKSV